MKNCVYILQCKDQRYYIGSTVELNTRLKQHSTGRVRFTQRRRPVHLLFAQEFNTRSEAYKIELWIKKQKSKKLIEQIIHEERIRKVIPVSP